MKNLNYILVFTVLLMFLSSCGPKVLEEDIVEEAVFYTEGMVDGEVFSLVAGPENVTIETMYSESINNLPVFITSFSNQNCATCSKRLDMVLVGQDISVGEISFEEKLPIGNYALDEYTADILPEGGDFLIMSSSSVDYSLFDDNGEVVIGTDGVVSDLDDGQYTMVAIGGIGCLATQTSTFDIVGGFLCSPLAQINITDTQFSFTIGDDFPMNNYVTEIFINDQLINLQPDVVVDINSIVPSGDIDNILVVVDDGVSCVSTNGWFFETPLVSSCDFSITMTSLSAAPPPIELSVSVKYTSEDAQEYVSISGSTGTLSVLEYAPYDEDPEGREAYRVRLNANMTLVNVMNNSDQISLSITDAYVPLVNE